MIDIKIILIVLLSYCLIVIIVIYSCCAFNISIFSLPSKKKFPFPLPFRNISGIMGTSTRKSEPMYLSHVPDFCKHSQEDTLVTAGRRPAAVPRQKRIRNEVSPDALMTINHTENTWKTTKK